MEQHYEALRQYLREHFSESFPPHFAPSDWAKNNGSTNCFAYALNANFPPVVQKIYMLNMQQDLYNRVTSPDFSRHKMSSEFYNTIILKEFIKKLKHLNIPFEIVDKPTRSSKESYTIALFASLLEEDFHVIRRDANNSWSHKPGWTKPPENLGKNFDKIKEELGKDYYEFVAFFKISKIN